MNTTSVVGNITREPELRQTHGGKSVCNFGIAVNRRYQKDGGEWVEDTSFLDVSCWGDLAKHVAQCLPKGCRVVVCGRLDQETWEGDSGEKRSRVQLVAEEVSPSLRFATVDVHKIDRSGTATE